MKVTIITPFYEGNPYMKQYQSVIRQNRKHMRPQDALEAILVNDSPWVAPELTLAEGEQAWWRVITNESNLGIHASRVRGLRVAGGEYVMFLDQDDMLSDNAIARMLEEVRRIDKEGEGFVLVANAVLEQEHGRDLWYRTKYHCRQVGRLSAYLTVGTQIISPGQCLLAAEVIPELWQRKICKKNGSDDYYLWLLLLQRGVPFYVLDQPLYIHRYTAKNLSADTKVTDASSYEFLGFLRESGDFPTAQAEQLERMLRYKAAFRRGGTAQKLLLSLGHPFLFANNVIYKIRTRTPYGFHR